MPELSDCKKYEEDHAICDDTGEPKGQCGHCGDKYFAHRNSALPVSELHLSLDGVRQHQGYVEESVTTDPRYIEAGPDAYADQRIIYCNHKGWFRGRVFITPFAIVVTPDAGQVNVDHLVRKQVADAQWHITTDGIEGGYANPQRGMFVLPRSSVSRVTPELLQQLGITND